MYYFLFKIQILELHVGFNGVGKASIDKDELLACKITSPFNNKLGCFLNKILMIAFQKEPIFLLNEEVIWQASDSPLSKELHAQTNNLPN